MTEAFPENAEIIYSDSADPIEFVVDDPALPGDIAAAILAAAEAAAQAAGTSLVDCERVRREILWIGDFYEHACEVTDGPLDWDDYLAQNDLVEQYAEIQRNNAIWLQVQVAAHAAAQLAMPGYQGPKELVVVAREHPSGEATDDNRQPFNGGWHDAIDPDDEEQAEGALPRLH